MNNDSEWYDAVDHSPGLVCECLLRDGRVVEGRYVCGEWEDTEGRQIFPTHFRPLRAVILTPLYGLPK